MTLMTKYHLAKQSRFENSFAKKKSVLKRPNVHSCTKETKLIRNDYITRKLIFQPVTSDSHVSMYLMPGTLDQDI